MRQRPSRERFLELDALRGVAAMSVLFFHYTTRYHELFGHTDRVYCSFPLGSCGVNLFFMISGFVILMTLDRCKRPLDFVFARFSRLYPVYWVAVIFTFAVVSICGLPGREYSLATLVANLTMFHGLFRFADVDSVYWTLVCELCFYGLIWGIFTLGLRRQLERALYAR